MDSLTEQIRRAWNALAFGDVGEVSDRGRMHALLNGQDALPTKPLEPPASKASAPRLIGLGVGDELPAPVMRYVIGVCRRMQANLLLLSTDPDRVRALLTDYLPDLGGIHCQTEALADASTSAVLRALNLHSGVLFAVSGSADDPLRRLLNGRRGSRSSVPIVVVDAEPRPTVQAGRRATRPPLASSNTQPHSTL